MVTRAVKYLVEVFQSAPLTGVRGDWLTTSQLVVGWWFQSAPLTGVRGD